MTKKNPERLFVDIGKRKMWHDFSQKIVNYMADEARQSFQFFRQKNWFLENKGVLFKFFYGIFICLISINKL